MFIAYILWDLCMSKVASITVQQIRIFVGFVRFDVVIMYHLLALDQFGILIHFYTRIHSLKQSFKLKNENQLHLNNLIEEK